MGNLGFIVPTENIEDNNPKRIQELLTKGVPDGIFVLDEEFDEIKIYHKDDDPNEMHPIATFYLKQDCYCLDFKRDIKEVKNISYELALDLEKLEILNPDLDNVIQMTGALSPNEDVKRQAEIFLHKHFKAYIFDEGIHPEFIPPDYVYKKKKSLLKKMLMK